MLTKISTIALLITLAVNLNALNAATGAFFDPSEGVGNVQASIIQNGFGLRGGQFKQAIPNIYFLYHQDHTYNLVCDGRVSYVYYTSAEWLLITKYEPATDRKGTDYFTFYGYDYQWKVDPHEADVQVGQPCPEGKWTYSQMSIPKGGQNVTSYYQNRSLKIWSL